MANRKKRLNKSNGNGSDERALTAAPRGFRKVELSLAGFWRPEGAGETIQGTVGHRIDVPGIDGRASTFYPLTLTSPDTSSIISANDTEVKAEVGMVVGVGGKMLLTFLQDRLGKEVCLVYRGLGKAKPRQSPPKLYDTYEREE